MSLIEKIQNIFSRKNRNIVFYFDEDGSLYEELPEIEAAGIKVHEVNSNYFELKYKLEYEWNNQQVFLYHHFAKPPGVELKKYPLLDLLIANAELRLDDASEFLADYSLQEHQLPLVKRYIKILKTKTNQKRLARILDRAHFNEDNLRQGFVSLALDFNSLADRHSCMAKILYLATDDNALIKALTRLNEWGLEKELCTWFNILLDVKINELNKETLVDLASRIKYNTITAYLSEAVEKDTYTKLKLQRTAGVNKLMVFFQDWANHQTLAAFVEPVFHILAKDIKSLNLMDWYGIDQEFGYYSAEMLQKVINQLYAGVSEHPLQTKDEGIKWMRSAFMSAQQKQQVKFIYHTAGVYIVLGAYQSFKFNTPNDFLREYTSELFKVDYNYRKALIAFEDVKDRLYEFEDEAARVFKTLNQKYDRFLIDLNVEWQKILNEHQFDYSKLDIDKQYDFYNTNLKGFEYKIVVIISDALRYELGYELYDDLLADSKNNLTLEPCLASIPSYTNLGMSNLLPNSGITVENGDQDLVFKIDNKPTVSMHRAAILQAAEPESTTIDFSVLKKMTKEEKRSFFKDSRITYVYHDWIDAVGDKKRTENEAFGATPKALDDLKWMIRNISGEMGIMHILVTSDHGFLYNHTELTETSREQLPVSIGYSRDHVRFVVADDFEGKVDGYQLGLKHTTNIKTDLKIAIPRAVNRYRKQGNVGVQFVHGGASLQELITPVIKFYKQKKETLQTVKFKRIDQADKIASGSIKIIFLQNQPVSNDYKSAEVIFGLYSDTAELYSNEVEVCFNSTSGNPKERIFEIFLSLNTAGTNASHCFLKAFDKRDKSKLNPLGLKDLIRISSIMEKDSW